jgi:hypothetical protein
MKRRVIISGGPGHGKTTLAEEMRKAMGLGHFLCTDTMAQAEKTGRSHPRALYAPPSLDGDWSGLSQWVADTWLGNRGPWVLEGVAAVRALRKWHHDNWADAPPCELLIRLTQPAMPLTARQTGMADADDLRFDELLTEWPELLRVVEMR